MMIRSCSATCCCLEDSTSQSLNNRDKPIQLETPVIRLLLHSRNLKIRLAACHPTIRLPLSKHKPPAAGKVMLDGCLRQLGNGFSTR